MAKAREPLRANTGTPVFFNLNTNTVPAMNPPMWARKATPPCPATLPAWLNSWPRNQKPSTIQAGTLITVTNRMIQANTLMLENGWRIK